MSLLPMLFSNWWEDLDKPHHIFYQHCGLSLEPEDLPVTGLSPLETNILVLKPCWDTQRRCQPYSRSMAHKTSGGVSTVQVDKNKFEVTLDVQHFTPEDISVKVDGKNVVIEGKHEEKEDEHGWVSRHFVRKYFIPEQCDIDQLKSTLSSNGVLTITAPRKQLQLGKKNERIIEIQKIEQPVLEEETQKTKEEQKPISVQNEQDEQLKKKSVHQKLQEQIVKAA